jgi:formylglycine-generating enzyme
MSRFLSLLLISCWAYISPLPAQKVESISKMEFISEEPSTPSVLTPFVEPQMIKVEGGTFQMGSDKYDEKPIHSVKVSNFYIGKYEVTQVEWRSIMGEDPKELTEFKGDTMPVHSVSWNDIQDFLQKINTKTGKIYRLPTEAEWEFAARGGNDSKGYTFSGSNDLKSVAETYKMNTVGGKIANELGIYDMSGNVWEWVQDWYKGYPGSSGVTDRTGADRVCRGDGWNGNENRCRSTNRYSAAPTRRGSNLGFRLALSL